MSAFDSESEASSVKEVVFEDFGDDVSIVERNEQPSVRTIIIKIALGLIFIGFATGCIVYSVITSESEHKEILNETLYFPWNLNQHCSQGTLTMTNRTTVANQYTTKKLGMSWMQDATRQRLFHRVGLKPNDTDWLASYYVFANHSFTLNKSGCERQNFGYVEFLRRQGLTYVEKQREEAFKIHNAYTDVNFFEGEPPLDVTVDGVHPALVRAYSSLNGALDYGWEYIFPQLNDGTSMFRKEMWFPNMVAGATDYSVFDSVPDICFEPKTLTTSTSQDHFEVL